MILVLFWTYLSIFAYAADTDTLVIYSESMKKKISTLVIIPDDYVKDNRSNSAVMLLHGYGGNFLDWSKNADLDITADEFNFILVCPDGSTNSWYLDSPIDQYSQYETYFINELIPQLKVLYMIDQLAVTGLSMGGHGCLLYTSPSPRD